MLPRLRKRFVVAALILACIIPVIAQSTDQRFNSIGHQMICTCGCYQILLECNHVGCTVSDAMRNKLSDALKSGDSDQVILASFVQSYGPTVLAAPTKKGFDLVAWIMPFAILLLGFGIAFLVIRSWKHETAPAESSSAAASVLRDQIRQETEL